VVGRGSALVVSLHRLGLSWKLWIAFDLHATDYTRTTMFWRNENCPSTESTGAGSTDPTRRTTTTTTTNRNMKETTNQISRIAFVVLVLQLIAISMLACNIALPKLTTTNEGFSSCIFVTSVVDATARAASARLDLQRFHDIKFLQLVGTGTVNYGFKAIFDDQEVIAKIAGDDMIYWSDIEMDMFDILNEPPTIPNIPPLLTSVRSMPNPFRNVTFLEKNLSVPVEDAQTIIAYRRISVIVMKFLPKSERLTTVQSVYIFTQSILRTLAFSHSRKVMNCDLHEDNYHFDGSMVSLYDWNAAYLFEKDTIPMIYDQAPMHLMPPEAQTNASAVHATVSAFDIYAIGLLLKQLLKGCCKVDNGHFMNGTSTTTFSGGDGYDDLTERKEKANKEEKGDRSTCSQMYDLTEQMLTADPYRRPDATQLLQHPLFNKK
jgi:hypothetical protein